jgi:hypothetical protein
MLTIATVAIVVVAAAMTWLGWTARHEPPGGYPRTRRRDRSDGDAVFIPIAVGDSGGGCGGGGGCDGGGCG